MAEKKKKKKKKKDGKSEDEIRIWNFDITFYAL
jgi:hypothetical protein